MLSDGFFRIGDYIWDWGSKKWIKMVKEHEEKSKKYFDEEYWNNRYKNNGEYWKKWSENYKNVTKKHWEEYMKDFKKYWEMNKNNMTQEWKDCKSDDFYYDKPCCSKNNIQLNDKSSAVNGNSSESSKSTNKTENTVKK